jgi:AcrR family transcriptional regulator
VAQPATERRGTRDRILDAAEQLFLEKGFRGASLRTLTTLAGVNLAAVGYHFGGKDELLRAVLERRIQPVNAERLRRLDTVEAGWRRGQARTVEPILRALLEPAFAAISDEGESRDIATLLYSEPHQGMPALIERLFGECARRFHAAISQSLGTRDPAALALRFQLLIGAMIHFLAGRHRHAPPFAGDMGAPSERVLIDEMVAFLSAGLRAPALPKTRTRRAPRAEESLR